MSAEVARGVVYLITTVAAVVWVTGLTFLIRSVPKRAPGTEGFDSSQGTPQCLIVGSAEIPGAPAGLSAKAAAFLANRQLKILQRTESRVVFEGVASDAAEKPASQYVRRGELRFTATGRDRTAVDYAIAVPAGGSLLVAGAVFQALGLVALVAGFFLMTTLVLPSPDPRVRAQSFQMLQVVHFLWPPFLLGTLHRKRRSAVQAEFETFVANLPYLGAPEP